MKTKRFVLKLIGSCLLMLAVAASVTIAAPAQSISVKEQNAASVAAFAMSQTTPTSAQVTATIYDRISIGTGAKLSADDLKDLKVYAGGMPFGVKFMTEGVTVVGFAEVEGKDGKVNPAAKAGLHAKDVILKIDGQALSGANDLTDRIEKSEGKPLALHCRRGKTEFDVTLTPVYCPAEARYKTGIWVRDSGAGIGTVTFILPDSGAFAGLGHGICDADTGELIAMRRGSVSDVTISSVVRGAAGAPGELKGYFNAGKVGALLGNSNCGVWGMFSEMPEIDSEPIEIGLHDEIQEGDAYILSTLDSNKTERYDVKISNINRDAKGPKCFTVTVTDPDLIACSGGIVQGMSGSPIIQNGKLVGAVTHVMVANPTEGYGIFIENMLNAAESQIQPKAA